MPTLAQPVVDDATRRDFLTLLATSGLLTACGGPADRPSTEPGYPRSVTTPDDGVVVLNAAPRRVAVLNGNRVIPFLLPFLGGGFELVGYGGEATAEEFPWIADQLRALPSAPDDDGVNLERIASWSPDLLLANGNVGDFWEPARAIAPLVQLPETDLRATVRLLGEVFADPAPAAATVAAYDSAVAAARRPTPLTAAVLSRYQDNGTLGVQVRGAELPNFLAELGIEVATSPTALDGYEDVSMELIRERLDVDRVVILNYGDDLQASLLNDPLFTAAPVIAQGRFVRLTTRQTAAGFPVTPPTVPVLLDALTPLLEANP